MSEDSQSNSEYFRINPLKDRPASLDDPLTHLGYHGKYYFPEREGRGGYTLSDQEQATIIDRAAAYMINKAKAKNLPLGNLHYDLSAARKIPSAIGKQFDAHGIAKGTIMDQLRSLDYLLTNGPNPGQAFHTANLAFDFPQFQPWTSGSFIVVGHPNTPILKGGIAGVLVSEPFESSTYFLIRKFQQKNPKLEFIDSRDLPQGFIARLAPKQ